MTLDEQITILEHNAEYERTHGNLQGCLDFRQLAAWLKEYKRILSQQKVGKWIFHPEWQADGECGYECNQCGMGSDIDYDFCMRCGAKMVQPQESEDKECR